MKLEIITIGDEILSGDILDTNKQYLSEKLWNNGFLVHYHTGIRDDEKDIADALERAVTRADAVLVTGGLGPTKDDFTIEIAAKTFGVSLVEDPGTLKLLQEWYGKQGRQVSENNRKQAFIPEGAVALHNCFGTAPGIHVVFKQVSFYFMPGVPKEMHAIFTESVLPDLIEQRRNKGEEVFFMTRVLQTFGLPESRMDQMLSDLFDTRVGMGRARIGFRVKFPDVYLKVSVWENSREESQKKLDEVLQNIRSRIGGFIYSENGGNLEEVLVKNLIEKNISVAVAESCTGGSVADRITNIPGASQIFRGGCIVYANELKTKFLGVSEKILSEHGAVSAECAESMVRGIQGATQVRFAAAVTGIAGPGGGSSDKPIGTVFVASLCDEHFFCKSYYLPFPRDMFKKVVSSIVLRRFWLALQGMDEPQF